MSYFDPRPSSPQIGDFVAVTHLGQADLGSVDVVTDYGALGVELDGDGRLCGIVLETDGGATHIAKSMVLKIERTEPR